MVEILFKKNPLQYFLSSLNAVMSIETGHVIYNLAYTYKFQLKHSFKNEWTLVYFRNSIGNSTTNPI